MTTILNDDRSRLCLMMTRIMIMTVMMKIILRALSTKTFDYLIMSNTCCYAHIVSE